jgi:hypothetical protein
MPHASHAGCIQLRRATMKTILSVPVIATVIGVALIGLVGGACSGSGNGASADGGDDGSTDCPDIIGSYALRW